MYPTERQLRKVSPEFRPDLCVQLLSCQPRLKKRAFNNSYSDPDLLQSQGMVSPELPDPLCMVSPEFRLPSTLMIIKRGLSPIFA